MITVGKPLHPTVVTGEVGETPHKHGKQCDGGGVGRTGKTSTSAVLPQTQLHCICAGRTQLPAALTSAPRDLTLVVVLVPRHSLEKKLHIGALSSNISPPDYQHSHTVCSWARFYRAGNLWQWTLKCATRKLSFYTGVWHRQHCKSKLKRVRRNTFVSGIPPPPHCTPSHSITHARTHGHAALRQFISS